MQPGKKTAQEIRITSWRLILVMLRTEIKKFYKIVIHNPCFVSFYMPTSPPDSRFIISVIT